MYESLFFYGFSHKVTASRSQRIVLVGVEVGFERGILSLFQWRLVFATDVRVIENMDAEDLPERRAEY